MEGKNLLNILEREYFVFSKNKDYNDPGNFDSVHIVNWFMLLVKLKLLLNLHSFLKNDFKVMSV